MQTEVLLLYPLWKWIFDELDQINESNGLIYPEIRGMQKEFKKCSAAAMADLGPHNGQPGRKGRLVEE